MGMLRAACNSDAPAKLFPFAPGRPRWAQRRALADGVAVGSCAGYPPKKLQTHFKAATGCPAGSY
eukprot:350454-Chlamydomonas_euryale.AAC.8